MGGRAGFQGLLWVAVLALQVWMGALMGAGASAGQVGLQRSASGVGLRPVTPSISLGAERYALCDYEDPFEVRGLPAISEDRAQVASVISESDGERGHPNLTLEVRAVRDGALVHTLTILPSDSGALSCFELMEATSDKLAEANAWLSARQWRQPRS